VLVQINMDVASLTPQPPGSPSPAADFMFWCVVKDQRSTTATITNPALAARSVHCVQLRRSSGIVDGLLST